MGIGLALGLLVGFGVLITVSLWSYLDANWRMWLKERNKDE